MLTTLAWTIRRYWFTTSLVVLVFVQLKIIAELSHFSNPLKEHERRMLQYFKGGGTTRRLSTSNELQAGSSNPNSNSTLVHNFFNKPRSLTNSSTTTLSQEGRKREDDEWGPSSVKATIENFRDFMAIQQQASSAGAAPLLSKKHQNNNNNNNTTKNVASSPYAYMFVIGGIHEDRQGYKGFLYDVLVAAQLLKEMGSTADIVLFIQFAEDSNANNKLPLREIQYLEALQINLRVLPKPTNKATFASLVFEKFRALQLTQYRRVIFMDADAIPLANLDYLFHLSDPKHATTPTILQPNLIMASRGEPCNSGVFMLEPSPTGWDELQSIIRRQQEEGAKLPYPHFSWERGWGYDFHAEQDRWLSNTMYGERWRFHAGHSDQGLLYYWTKFHVRNVSIVIQDRVENWIDPPNPSKARRTVDGKLKPVFLGKLTDEPLLRYSNPNGPLAYQMDCNTPDKYKRLKKDQPHQCLVPYRDIAHFMGHTNKPWMAYSAMKRMRDENNTSLYFSAMALWFKKLALLNVKLGMGLHFNDWHEKHAKHIAPPLGRMAKLGDIKQK